MAQLDALRLADALRQRLVDYAADDNFVRDPSLAALCRRLWAGAPEHGGLLSDLWVEGAFPAAESEKSLDHLVHDRIFDPELCAGLDKPDAVPRHRLLYSHQYQTLLKAQERGPEGERPAIVVTAGTGAGKTEAFLLPILNDLYSRPDESAEGIKCLILYPMNALVNDQMDRLYTWLSEQTRVTLFHFTSETPEDKRRADNDGMPTWNACRMRTRQEARGRETHEGRSVEPQQRGRIPDIVITNYSMLEYMLCRPQDAVFFGPALRAIVLDEAHLYTGTLAAEITLLLRRLLARCGVSPSQVLQMATSATLGGGDGDVLRDFVATLFSKAPRLVHVIQGESARVPMPPIATPMDAPTAAGVAGHTWLDRPLLVADATGRLTLAQESELCQRLREPLALLVADAVVRASGEEQRPAVLLHATLGAAPLIHSLEQLLWERKRLPLGELAALLWGHDEKDAISATIVLLQLAASARRQPTDYPLVPHRIHLMVRPSDGLSVCLNSACSGDADRRFSPLGTVSTGIQERCHECGSAMLSLYRCANCGEWLLAGRVDGNHIRPAPWTPYRGELSEVEGSEEQVQYFTLGVGTEENAVVVLDPATGERSGAGAPGLMAASASRCPACGGDRADLEAFVSRTPLTLSILAETVLAELPPFPSPHNHWLPARGRRMLAFSDSRQEAARLGPRLTRQHETQLVRAALTNCLSQNLVADEATVADVRSDLQGVQARLADLRLTPAQRQRLETQAEEYQRQLRQFTAGGSIGDWTTAFSEQEVLAEMLDAETAKQHRARQQSSKGPRDWSQQDWEDNRKQIRDRSRTFLAQELARRLRVSKGGSSTLETLGLVEVTYPELETVRAPAAFLGALPAEEARQRLSDCWPALLSALCDTLRSEGVITLGDDQEDAAYPFGAMLIGHWCAERDEWGGALVRFVGQTPRQRRRWFAAAVLRACGLTEEDAEARSVELLRAVFRQFLDRAVPSGQNPGPDLFGWMQRSVRQASGGPPADGLRLVFTELGLKRPVQLFRCDRTGHVWCRSVLGCAPEFGCAGTLQPVSEAALNDDPRLGRQRREYRESPVFQIGLWAEEHSAQLSPGENRRLQELFKAGVRNILSATTTMELGIDIGGLNAVLMSNVPPGKANYLQRAGRAGRRSDGSSVVITFARPRPFDREVFSRIGDYLDRPLRQPRVFLDRDRVVRRHFHAFLLGQFFQAIYPPGLHVGAMTAFGNMGAFCGVPRTPHWDRGEGEKPTMVQSRVAESRGADDLPWWDSAAQLSGLEAQYRSYLRWVRDRGEERLRQVVGMLFDGTAMAARVCDWPAMLDDVIAQFDGAIRSWRSEYEPLLQSWQEIEQRAQANAIRYQLSALYDLTVIEALADHQFLPRYGFPIGIHKLRVIAPDEERRGRIREEDQYRLERGSLLALREYVPGSQLLVGGRLVSSHGLLKHWTGAVIDTYLGLRGQYCRCRNGHFYYWLSGSAEVCPVCGDPPGENPGDLLFPTHGFSGAAWDPPRWSTDVERVGQAETVTITFAQHGSGSIGFSQSDLGGVTGLAARYREDGEMLVYNRGEREHGFAICLRCGYAESERHVGQGTIRLPARFQRHAPLTSPSRWATCWRDDAAPVLRNQVLAARETTDVLLLDFSGCLGQHAAHEPLVTTLAYALQRAGARLLELDTRELGVLVVPAGTGGRSLGAVIYDSVPGGAGHVRELLALGRDWLGEARTVLFVSEPHDSRCETACLDCLLSFDAQEIMTRNLFDRRFAMAALDAMLGGAPLIGPSPESQALSPMPDSSGTEATPATERLNQARERLQRRRN